MEKEYDLDLVLEAGAAPDLGTIFDLDRLHRLHPHWIVEGASETEGGTRFEIRDHATDLRFSHFACLIFEKGDSGPPGFELRLKGGSLAGFRLFVKGDRWTVATQTPPAEMEENLLLWLRGIREYLRLYLTTSLNTLVFRHLMNKMILPMIKAPLKKFVDGLVDKIEGFDFPE
jgi:hypothetical protein